MTFSAEIYHSEEGKDVVEEQVTLIATDLPSAELEATEWAADLAAVLYQSTDLRIRQNGSVVRERALGEEPWV